MSTTQSPTGDRNPRLQFRLRCDCGCLVSGPRGTREQRLSCDQCGTVLFVLPEDVYPTWDPASRAAAAGKKPRTRVRSGVSRAERPPDRAEKRVPKQKLRLTQQGQLGRLRVTALQRVVLGLVAAVLLTAFWMMRQTQLESASEQFRRQRLAGVTAFRAHRWNDAYVALTAASEAAKTSGRSDLQSREVEQLLRESRACSKLSSTSLFSALKDAGEHASGPKPDRVESRVGRGWLIFDATTRLAAPGLREQASFVIDFPLSVASHSIQLQTSAPALRKLSLAEESRRAVFAAQVDRSHIEADSGTWVIHLNSDSLFLWSDEGALRALGLIGDDQESDREIQQLLQRQTRLLELDGT